ncbi:hypothetical protein CLV56_2928 [Mumia flava]|uniref:Uncharacterized protein n=1 Tax=Mumia flava TaxID=1348852 RepID=A0A0B2B891_9ACTN|nr:hypothetical protein [Mumia flava]PJJ53439.1 hypothetical protein CLV56_2928 [Mumia flava]
MSTARTVTLEELTRALRDAWDADTCAPEDRPAWSPQNPARGQCITTVLVVHDFLGGELVRGEVHVGGQQVDYHWWNRLADGTEIDLTREQFGADELVTGRQMVERPTGPHRVEREYERLSTRVLDRLDAADDPKTR